MNTEKTLFQKNLDWFKKENIVTIERAMVEIQSEEITDGLYDGMFGVSAPSGFIGFFYEENEACRFRLDYINFTSHSLLF